MPVPLTGLPRGPARGLASGRTILLRPRVRERFPRRDVGADPGSRGNGQRTKRRPNEPRYLFRGSPATRGSAGKTEWIHPPHAPCRLVSGHSKASARFLHQQDPSQFVASVMDESGSSEAPRGSRRDDVVQGLVSAREMSRDEADDWCDSWEEHAAGRGLESEDPHFWDSGRGWIDAQLVYAPAEMRRRAVRRLNEVTAARKRATPGSSKHKTLLEEERRIAGRMSSLEGDVAAQRRVGNANGSGDPGATSGGRWIKKG